MTIALAACAPAPAEESTLVLVPAALATAGRVSRDRGETLCLYPGSSATADLYVHQPEVRVTVDVVQGGAPQSLAITAGDTTVAAPTRQLPAEGEHTYRARPRRGLQRLRLTAPAANSLPICIRKVAIAQP